MANELYKGFKVSGQGLLRIRTLENQIECEMNVGLM